MKKHLAGLLLFVLLVSALPLFASAGENTWPGFGDNVLAHEYINDNTWSQCVYSYLYENPDGTYTRVEWIGTAVAVDQYSAGLEFVSGQKLEMELPLFGGFYHGKTHNFLIFGQENPEEDDSAEVIRVVKFTHDWQRAGEYRLCGGNTTVPFWGGSLRCAEYDGVLHIRTCHEMYADEYGDNHQSNLMLSLNISDMSLHNSLTDVWNNEYGYISHSFNQFIAMDADRIIAVDHGDAHPRSVALLRYPVTPGNDSYYGRTELVDVLPIHGRSGNNDTGVNVGGLAVTDTAYLVVGNTVDQEATPWSLWGQRNIFVTATPKDDFTEEATIIRYLTGYDENTNLSLTNPQLIPVDADRYLVLWGESGDGFVTKYVFVDGNGEVLSPTYESDLLLQSDCQPVVSNGKVIWYAARSSVPRFMTIDLENPEQVTHECVHGFWLEENPSYTETSVLGCECMLCGDGFELEIPALNAPELLKEMLVEPDCGTNGQAIFEIIYDIGIRILLTGPYGLDGHPAEFVQRVEPSCDERGYDLYRCPNCGVELRANEVSSLGGHLYGEWELPEEYECETTVEQHRSCLRCETEEQKQVFVSHDLMEEEIPSNCFEDGLIHWECSHCGFSPPDEENTSDYSMGHYYDMDWQTLREPDCQTNGVKVRYCADCGFPDFMNPRALGHDYAEGICTRCGHEEGTDTEHIHSYTRMTVEPSCTEPGYIHNHCDCWAADYDEPIGEPLGHRVVKYVFQLESCMGEGLLVVGCIRCGLTEYTEPIPPTGHEYEDGVCNWCDAIDHDHEFVTEVREADCEKTGLTIYTCVDCGYSYETDWVKNLGHDLQPFEEEPTCTEWGSKGYSCTRCSYREGSTKAPLGHDYADGICQRCGEEHDHRFTMKTVRVDPTCTEPGAVIESCECGYRDETPIPALGHADQETVTDPTCTDAGSIIRICTRCERNEEEPIPALGHDYRNGVCSRCGDADPEQITCPFVDVPEGAYYFESVLWAVKNGITQGINADHFGPDNQCTRAQVVTFLWRASGCPEPERSDEPFTDVTEDAYYYKPVLWALENGITQGLSATVFGPDQPCTRAQVVTFLWRAAGSPSPEKGDVPFEDVSADAYYCEPMLWAVENGITQGMGHGLFGVNGVCSRAQIVTFLYRANN